MRPRSGAARAVADALAHFLYLCNFRVFLLNTFGQTMWTANVGALAYWGPKVRLLSPQTLPPFFPLVLFPSSLPRRGKPRCVRGRPCRSHQLWRSPFPGEEVEGNQEREGGVPRRPATTLAGFPTGFGRLHAHRPCANALFAAHQAGSGAPGARKCPHARGSALANSLQAARQLFDLRPERVDLLFGALTAATSVSGTLAGAAVSDLLGSSLRRSMFVSGFVTLAAFLLMELAFASATVVTFPTFMAVLGLGMFFLFGASGPSNAVNMWSVPVDLRPQAVSFSTILSHLIGDVPSPPALGWLQDAVIHHWGVTMCTATLLILGSSTFYLSGSLLASPAADHRVTEPNPQHPEEAEQHLHDDEDPEEECHE